MIQLKPPILTITGPTASGKSVLAEELARRFPIEIISVDSAVVYRGMDIGTAKPTQEIRREIPHHLIDIRDPATAYSAADFREDAINVVEQVLSRGRIPCLAGGTMLYLKALKQGIVQLPSADPVVRQEISERAERDGWPEIHAELALVDPAAAARIGPNDPQRLQRALEVYVLTGCALSDHHKKGNPDCPFDLVEVAILPERQLLHQRIAGRFQEMLHRGLVHEVGKLLEREDINSELPAMKSVGYRQVAHYLAGLYDHEEMEDRAIAATRRLAKHQYTWLNSWHGLHRLPEPDTEKVLKIDPVISILESGGESTG